VCIINDEGKGWDVSGLLAGTPIRSNCIVKKINDTREPDEEISGKI